MKGVERDATRRFDNIVGQLEGASLLSDAISDRRADFALTCVCMCKCSELPYDGGHLLALLQCFCMLICLALAARELE